MSIANQADIAQVLSQALLSLNQKDFSNAEALCRQVLAQRPHAIDALHILGLSLHEQSQNPEAIATLRDVLALNPGEHHGWLHLGKMLEADKQWTAAITAYENELASMPAPHRASTPLVDHVAKLKVRAGQVDGALQLVAAKLAAHPTDKSVWLAYGKLLLDANRLEEAAAHYRQAVAALPDFFDAWICLGNVLRGLRQPQASADSNRAAIALQPNSALAHANLGTAYLDLGDFDQARQWYGKAIALQPDYMGARLLQCITEIPMLYGQQSQIAQSRQRYTEALAALTAWCAHHPDDLRKLGRYVGHMQPFLLPYQGYNDRELQKHYGTLMCKAVAAEYGRHAVSKAHRPKEGASGKLRIAFVGATFCGHSVWKAFTRGWVEQLDRKRYELACYYTQVKGDQQTDYARRLFDHFEQANLEADEWMQRIRDYDPHLIIYPEVGMDPMTAKLAALRMAPVQCVTWGHPETTGYDSLDYYLSGELLEPLDADQHYCETLVLLHGTSAHYTPMTVPKREMTRAELGLAQDEIGYLCCQNLFKYLPDYDDVLVTIAKAVPQARFVFFRHKVAETCTRVFIERVSTAFRSAGLVPDTFLRFNPWLDLPAYDAMLRQMDVYLDSIGFSGFNTAIEALGAGLPVVTCQGGFMRGRLASAILRQIGLAEWIASDATGFAALAIKLGSQQALRAQLKTLVLERLPRAYEDKQAIRSLEAFIEKACGHMRPEQYRQQATRLQDKAAMLMRAHHHDEAEPLLNEALQLWPDFAMALSNMGVIHMTRGRTAQAMACYRKALQLQPDFADAAYNLARALFRSGKLQESIQWYEKAVALYGPDSAKALNGLGNVHRTLNKPDKALEYAEKAIQLEPDYAEGWMNLGSTYRDLGRVEDAIAAYERAITLDPAMPQPRLHRCNLLIPQGYATQQDVAASRLRYSTALQELRTRYLEHNRQDLAVLGKVITTSQPFYIPYQEMNDRELLMQHGDLVSKAVEAAYPGLSITQDHKPKADAEGKIRVGVVMGFFREHSVWKAIIKGWMENLDRSKFALYGYHTQTFQDKQTRLARSLCRRFVQGPLEHRQWCQQIRQDDLHVLIYPEVGMDPDAASLAAMRLAPVQCVTWGHPETSGLPTLDYYLSGTLLEPGASAQHYAEKLVCLPNTSVCYAPVPFAPSAKQRADFGLQPSDVVYLSCQNPFKYLPCYDEVFPRIAAQTPHSRFVFFRHKRSHGLNNLFEKRLHDIFASHGLKAHHHVVILDWQSFKDFQALLAIADVFLDTIGFSGFNTANEALAAGLPVVTRRGRFMRGNLAAAILDHIDVTETVADDIDGYVRCAIRLGNDVPWRCAVRQHIGRNLGRAYNDRAPVKALEKFLTGVANPMPPTPAWHLLTAEPGSDTHAYNHEYAPRGLIQMAQKAPQLVLDVGCFVGATGAHIKQQWPASRVIGIEPNPEAARRAATRMDHVTCATLEKMDWSAAGVAPHTLDMVVLADVLEHVYNPWHALQLLKPWLKPDADVLISLPNVRNLWLLDRLLNNGEWRYERSGLLDVTHIRFFALADARRMLDETGYRIEDIKMNPDQRLTLYSSQQIGPGQSAEVSLGRVQLRGITAADMAELTALQFFIRCRPQAE